MYRSLLLCLTLLAVACASAQPPTDSQAAPAVAATDSSASQPPVIASLQTRDHLLRIYEGGTFDLLDAERNVLAAGLSETELESQFPEAHATYRTAIADGIVPVMADVDSSLAAP